MEVFMNFGTEAQKAEWLTPLLAGEIRSSYAMTEPQVASSDATNVQLSIRKDGDSWVLNGRKWFITGALYDRCKILIVMGKSDPENSNRHLQQSQVLVPKDTPGVNIIRPLTTLGYDDAPLGHAEIVFDEVRVLLPTCLQGRGGVLRSLKHGWPPGVCIIVCALLVPGSRPWKMACQRVTDRQTFGRPLSKHQSIRENISKCFSEVEMARLLVQKTCWTIDNQGVKASIPMIAATKTTVPLVIQTVIDRCMQMHGAGDLLKTGLWRRTLITRVGVVRRMAPTRFTKWLWANRLLSDFPISEGE